jgi:hypothetical protein
LSNGHAKQDQQQDIDGINWVVLSIWLKLRSPNQWRNHLRPILTFNEILFHIYKLLRDRI